MACKAFRRAVTENQLQIVPMRTDQTHSAIDFLRPHLRQLEMESLLEVCNVVDTGNPCRIGEFGIQRGPQTALVSNRRRPGFGCDGTIRIRPTRRQTMDKLEESTEDSRVGNE